MKQGPVRLRDGASAFRTAILLSHPLPAETEVPTGTRPRQDYFALAQKMDAELISSGRPGRSAAGKLLHMAKCSWAGFSAGSRYDLIISDLDRPGLLLALLQRISRARRAHLLICHGKIARAPDRWLLRWLQLHRNIDRFICYGPDVAARLRSALPACADRIVTVRHAADHQFWHPLAVPQERLIVGAGLLRRDYPTLIQALKDLDVRVELAAHSPWVTAHATGLRESQFPPNVRLGRYDYVGLRALYARAAAVAVPLLESRSSSGSLVVYEAMAMGKPVVVTRTIGQATLGVVEHGKTGFYIAPGDVLGWREAVAYLLDHPEEAARMGRAARSVVEAALNLDTFVEDVLRITREAVTEYRDGSPPRR